ncbi:MAG: protein kinase domain-containing protein, partial [Planctomyces sp.]
KFLRGSPVAVREAILLLNSLCAAVSHAHLQGVIHRDLKPSNVLLSWQGQPESAARKLSNATIKITDFGLARVIDASQQTEAGQRVGTPGYMSPEQVAGDVAATGERTDVYG